MYISSSTVTLTFCVYTSNTAVRSVVQVSCPMSQKLNLYLSVSVVSVDFSMCVKCRRCSGRLADVANTNLSLPVSVVSVVFSM